MPLLILGLLILRLIYPPVDGEPRAASCSTVSRGLAHPIPLLISLGIGLFVGFLAQRSRFCTMGALRDLILFRQIHLFTGFAALLLAAWLANLAIGQFNPGFAGQPVAHTQSFWNFSGMFVAGLAFALAGGCPGRQLFMSGKGCRCGNLRAGMITGAAFSHNFGLASSPAGIGPHGMAALIIGLMICLLIGFSNVQRVRA